MLATLQPCHQRFPTRQGDDTPEAKIETKTCTWALTRARWRANNKHEKAKIGTYLISTLDHALFPLHLDVLLFLGVSQRPRDTNQESTGADNPQSLSTERQAGFAEGCERGDGVGDGAARGGRDHVFQGGDTLVEGFLFEDFFFFVGDFRFCVS